MFLNGHGEILMKGKTHSTEEIIRILRQADGGETALYCVPGTQHLRADLLSVEEEIRRYGFSRCQTAQRAGKRKRRVKKMWAESMLENRVLKEVNSKKWYALRRKS